MECAELGDATCEHETILKLLLQAYFKYLLTNYVFRNFIWWIYSYTQRGLYMKKILDRNPQSVCTCSQLLFSWHKSRKLFDSNVTQVMPIHILATITSIHTEASAKQSEYHGRIWRPSPFIFRQHHLTFYRWIVMECFHYAFWHSDCNQCHHDSELGYIATMVRNITLIYPMIICIEGNAKQISWHKLW